MDATPPPAADFATVRRLLKQLEVAPGDTAILSQRLAAFAQAMRAEWIGIDCLVVFAADSANVLHLRHMEPPEGSVSPLDDVIMQRSLHAQRLVMATDAGRTSYALPLRANEKSVGLLYLHWSDEASPPAEFDELLEMLAAPLAVAIIEKPSPSSAESSTPAEPAAATDQPVALPDALTLLGDLAEQLSVNLGSYGVLQDICQSLGASLGLGYVSMWKFEPGGQVARLIGEHPAHLGREASLNLADVPLLARFSGAASEAGPAVLTLPAAEIITTLREAQNLVGPQPNSALLAPLLAQNDLLGLLVLVGHSAEPAFSAEQQQIARIAAAQIALSLRNTELFTELQRRANQLERIGAFGRLITSTFDQREILQRVMDVLPNLLPVDQLSLFLHSPGQRKMRHIILVNNAAPIENDLPAAGSSIEAMEQSQTPLHAPDLSQSEYADLQQLAAGGFRSALSAPLLVGGRSMGAINVASRVADAFTPTDMTLLQQFGNQIAIALENARQFQLAESRASYEESLSEITGHLQEQTDLRTMLQQAMSDLGRVLGARQARVNLQTPIPSGDDGQGKE